MQVLQLRDPRVRNATMHPAVAGLKRIARGAFCAVYDKGDTVLKLTCDAKQYALYADPCVPTGDYFPTLIEDHGEVGKTHCGLSLYLVEMEKLGRIGRDAPITLKRLAKQLVDTVSNNYQNAAMPERSMWEKKRRAIFTIGETSRDESLPLGLRESLEELEVFMSNYDCGLDFHMANLMRRGDQLVLNDVVADVDTYNKRQFRLA